MELGKCLIQSVSLISNHLRLLIFPENKPKLQQKILKIFHIIKLIVLIWFRWLMAGTIYWCQSQVDWQHWTFLEADSVSWCWLVPGPQGGEWLVRVSWAHWLIIHLTSRNILHYHNASAQHTTHTDHRLTDCLNLITSTRCLDNVPSFSNLTELNQSSTSVLPPRKNSFNLLYKYVDLSLWDSLWLQLFSQPQQIFLKCNCWSKKCW